MEITVLLADDDPVMCKILRSILLELPDVKVVGEAHNGLETLRLVKKLEPQIVFLDIAMPQKDGLEIAQEIRIIMPMTIIIFATAYENYTHEAFEVYAFDYLIKPYRINRIYKTIERIKFWFGTENKPNDIFSDKARSEIRESIIVVKEYGKNIFINLKDIIFITRDARFTTIHFIGGIIKTSETLELLNNKLNGDSFFRCHRGYIINLNMIKEIQPCGKKTFKVFMRNTTETVLMTKSKASAIKDLLFINKTRSPN
ncbi:two component transcriptional regulator, LytTR family [Desulfofarcimen acetoxidans DSM 771]|uniref:Stage 0 sporulation protein A homolog n=1 Tax=Desulfofarcimen acetoxidans (strain ATCC 49208 / DSM 771 / KCTC 5769 / VKM B-1644 / 5575) TaxID=485916 RepID=C8W4Q6_DESAS|nr:LytTR family DNA-binding domain-containing protein [Desulfofarcimen acetoxidans]ACV63942.1 two component transcriptional regulator, LytTR family [Desulfofarcimen acetoxidans DSM 771]